MRAIGPPLSDAEREQMLAFARSQIGVSFRHQGRRPGRRLDCLGLIVCALRAIGREPEDRAAYGREPHRDGLMEGLAANLGEPLAPSVAIAPGDVLAMRMRGEPCHVAFVADYLHGGLSLLHTSAAFGQVIEHSLDEASRSYSIVEAFRP
jgi:cell wall-associated NlpC family hydrolase